MFTVVGAVEPGDQAAGNIQPGQVQRAMGKNRRQQNEQAVVAFINAAQPSCIAAPDRPGQPGCRSDAKSDIDATRQSIDQSRRKPRVKSRSESQREQQVISLVCPDRRDVVAAIQGCWAPGISGKRPGEEVLADSARHHIGIAASAKRQDSHAGQGNDSEQQRDASLTTSTIRKSANQ
jgi:hypothetical protein